MKKHGWKLALRRETLRSLSRLDLARVAGAAAGAIDPGISRNDTCLCAPTRIGCETEVTVA